MDLRLRGHSRKPAIAWRRSPDSRSPGTFGGGHRDRVTSLLCASVFVARAAVRPSRRQCLRLANDHNVYFYVRTVAQDPNPDPVDLAPPDPVRMAQGVTVPTEIFNRLRQARLGRGPQLHALG